MVTEEHPHPKNSTVIVDLEGARALGPTEAADLLRDCLTLTHKRLETSLRIAVDTPHMWWQFSAVDEAGSPVQDTRDGELISILRAARAAFVPQFQAAFAEAFRQRMQGHMRATARRHASRGMALTLVGEEDLSGQVSLKRTIREMHDACRAELFALNFRARLLLRETPDGKQFDNPWSPDYLCDTFGTVCRSLWSDSLVWRPIMEQLVRFITPHAVKLYRELNGYLQDRDVLPTLRVRLRGRDGKVRSEPREAGSLYSTLRQLLDSRTAAKTDPAGAMPNEPFSGVTYGAGDGSNPWSGNAKLTGAYAAVAAGATLSEPLRQALENLQRGAMPNVGSQALLPLGGQAALPLEDQIPLPIDLSVLNSGVANMWSQVKLALGEQLAAADRITMDIVDGLFDYLYNDPTLPVEIKSVFVQLQIPVLKAALLDRNLFTDARHPVRVFIEMLADAGAGLDPERPDDRSLLELMRRLVVTIREQFADDAQVFVNAKAELAAFLAAERQNIDRRFTDAIEPLLHEDAHAAARAEVQPEMAARLLGRHVPAAIRAFLEHEWVDRWTAVYEKSGPDSQVWQDELAIISEFLWSLTPKTNAEDRKRLSQVVAKLVRVFNDGRPVDAASEPRRKAFLACMFMRHLNALRGTEATVEAESANAPAVDDGEPDQCDDQVAELVRGDWVEFRVADDVKPVLARLAWRSPQRMRLLFTHRDGNPAFVRTPEELAEEFRGGKASIIMETAPLFERALNRLIDRYSQPAGTPAPTA